MNLVTPPEHPFAQFVRILGKGKRGARNLTREEAREAMGMLLDGKVEDTQLGAFLMLLRHKEESAEELAGFTECFVVGTAAEVTPVGQIGEYSFTPGALSLGLADDYARMVRRQLAPA